MFLVGKLYPFLPDVSKWSKKGKKWFEKEVEYQIYEDGTFLFAGSVLNHNRIEHGDYWLESEDGKIYLKMQADNQFVPANVPIPADHLRQEGLGESFITYMSGWPGFVEGS